MKALKMLPSYKDYIWGGAKLRDVYGKDTPYAITAESWEVACSDSGMSRICGGEYGGLTLAEAIADAASSGADWLGSNCAEFDGFPVLIKLIDACDNLSIQVHPDDVYANANENGSQGKTEVWYVVDAEPGAELIYGLARDTERDAIRSAIETDGLKPYLNSVKIHAGDVFFIPAGMIHAIGKGAFICEIQQNSNITYRVYDWGRVGADGKPRELHIDKALDVMNFSAVSFGNYTPQLISSTENSSEYKIAVCEYFNVIKRTQTGRTSLATDGKSFMAITFVRGCGELISPDGTDCFVAGDSFFIPAPPSEYIVAGDCEYLITRV